jgi:hypothetical protein
MKKRNSQGSLEASGPDGLDAQNPKATAVVSPRAYSSPQLQCFGDIRAVTLGGSPGFSDSSNVPQNMLM